MPGGLIGACLLIDPTLSKNDKLKGNLLGAKGTLPEVYTSITIKFYLMRRLLGAAQK